MREIILQTQYIGIMLVVACVLILLAALLSLFSDRDFRCVGWLTILIFGVSYFCIFSVLEIQDIELPRWMQVGRGHGKHGEYILLLWGFASRKLADWLYYRHIG